MKVSDFKINKRIEFIEKEEQIGISLIQDIQQDFMLVTIPMKRNKKQLLSLGKEVDGIYYKDGDAFLFTVQIMEQIFDNIPLYKTSIPTTFERIQRRNFVRIPISIPIVYMENNKQLEEMVEKEELEVIEKTFENKWSNGYTMDLSGGGMKISLKKPIKANKEIFIIIKQKDLYIGVKGRAIRCIPFIFKKHVSYHMGIKFVDIPDKKREKIIQFIFKKMREFRQKDK